MTKSRRFALIALALAAVSTGAVGIARAASPAARGAAALAEVDSAGMAKLGLWGFPGTRELNERALSLFHTDYDHLLAAVWDATKNTDEKTAARVRCHVHQTEAVDLLVQAEQRQKQLEVDEHGQVEVSLLVPAMRSEGLEDDRSYTLERREDDNEVVFIARGVGEMKGDVWVRHLPKSADWMHAMFAPITIANDVCARL